MGLHRIWIGTILFLVSTAFADGRSASGLTGSCPPIEGGEATQEVRYTGELTRKGSDTDSWWALRIDSGTVYRLELADKALEKSFFDWQYRRVTVTGALRGKFLSLDVICVHEARLD